MHFFDKTSPLCGMERMMKTVPDFRSRASPGTPSCKLCTEYRRHGSDGGGAVKRRLQNQKNVAQKFGKERKSK